MGVLDKSSQLRKTREVEMLDRNAKIIKPFTDLVLALPEVPSLAVSFVDSMQSPLDFSSYLKRFDTFPVNFDFVRIFLAQFTQEEKNQLFASEIMGIYQKIEEQFQIWKKASASPKKVEDAEKVDLIDPVENAKGNEGKIQERFQLALSEYYEEFYFGEKPNTGNPNSPNYGLFKINLGEKNIVLEDLRSKVIESRKENVKKIYDFLNNSNNSRDEFLSFLKNIYVISDDEATILSERLEGAFRKKKKTLDTFFSATPFISTCFTPNKYNRILWNLYSKEKLTLKNFKSELVKAGEYLWNQESDEYNNYLQEVIQCFNAEIKNHTDFNAWKKRENGKNKNKSEPKTEEEKLENERSEKVGESFRREFLEVSRKSLFCFLLEYFQATTNEEEKKYFYGCIKKILNDNDKNATSLVNSLSEIIELLKSDGLLSLDSFGADDFQKAIKDVLSNSFQLEVYTEDQLNQLQKNAEIFCDLFNIFRENLSCHSSQEENDDFLLGSLKQDVQTIFKEQFKGMADFLNHIHQVDLSKIKKDSQNKLHVLKASAELCQQELAERLVREFIAVNPGDANLKKVIDSVNQYDQGIDQADFDSATQSTATDDSDGYGQTPKSTPMKQETSKDILIPEQSDDEDEKQAKVEEGKTNSGSKGNMQPSNFWVDLYENQLKSQISSTTKKWICYRGEAVKIRTPRYPQFSQAQAEYEAVKKISEANTIKEYSDRFSKAKKNGLLSSVGWFTRKIYAILQSLGLISRDIKIETVGSSFKKCVKKQLDNATTADFFNAIKESDRSEDEVLDKSESLIEEDTGEIENNLGASLDENTLAQDSIREGKNKVEEQELKKSNLKSETKFVKKQCLNHFGLFSKSAVAAPDFMNHARCLAGKV